MTPFTPVVRDLVLIGGGHAHVAVIKGMAMHPIAGTRLTVISRDSMSPYSGMLPGYLAGHYSLDDSHIDLQRLCRFAGARFYHAAVEGIDPVARRIVCAGRPPVTFDLLSIDIGSTPSHFGISGVDLHAVPIKPISGFLQHLARLETLLSTLTGEHHIAIIGGGAGGTELCLSLRHRLRAHISANGRNPDHLHFSIISNSASLLPQHSRGVVRRMHQAATQAGIALHLMRRVTRIDASGITFSDGAYLSCDTVILATHAGAPAWLGQTGLALDARGFIQVQDTLESVSHPGIFAAGDIAAMKSRKLEKSGVYAVRQGPALLKNLRLTAGNKSGVAFRPQHRTLALISTGNPHAIASYGPIAFEGDWVWRLKDRIDRRWIQKYQQLPERLDQIVAESSDSNALLCGGCGAKLPADILQETLATLSQVHSPDIITGLDTPDDAAIITPPRDKLIVQTVDQFRSFLDDPYLFGRITANHCLNDIFAMGANPHSALALVTLPLGPDEKLRQEMRQIMQGAMDTLTAANVILIGGHSALGAEMMLGFTINGIADPAEIWRKSGAQPGDALILTKPLGTGALLAADMRAQANASWMEAAIGMMLQSNGSAADCLGIYGATACTDVSGFGLAGHLAEMLSASALGASLYLDALPALPGISETLARGINSSLHLANRRNGESVMQTGAEISTDPNYDLLFDPQTSGGLLAAIAPDKAEDCIKALHALGYAHAAIIGDIRPRAAAANAIYLMRSKLA